ncbi:MAG TPA: type IV toxin-antitoxin system AbiEi family antitoxin [Arachnia sp.]|jgi:hypothetical protein|nr:type IV toxin-antitoxin system AbiEi family antitoxin [Arachnia sp.]
MDLLTEAIAEVLRELGVETEGEPVLVATVPTRRGPVRAEVDLKRRSQPLSPAEAARWLDSRPADAILALPAIPRARGDQYRALGVNYVDSGGNAFLSFPGFRVQIEGRKPRVTLESGTRARPASTSPAGLKVAFVLLVARGSIAASHERLAALAQVSKGTVTNVLADLRLRGHVFGEAEKRVLIDEDRLAKDWVDGYVRDLRPRLRELEVRGPGAAWWIRHWRDAAAGVIGGGAALAELGADLRPDRAVVYGLPPWQEIRREARLSRDGEASVVLRERFWSGDLLGEARFVPPLLAYADALTDADPREVDAARGLAKRFGWGWAE